MYDINFRGISTFSLFAIPAVLGLAAIYWLTFVRGAHRFGKEVSQENRRNVYVGAKVLPKEPIKLEPKNIESEPLQIDTIDLDGDYALVRFHNSGHRPIHYAQVLYKGYAPDGTVVAHDSNYVISGDETIDPGEKMEWRSKYFKDDPRVVRVVFTMTGSNY